MNKWTQDALAAAHTQREIDTIPQSVTPAQAAQWMNEAVDEETQDRQARIDQLQPYKDELEKIAEDLGEAEDPFAAWEAVEALKAELAAEKALADALWRGGQGVAYRDRPQCLDEALAAYRKARGM